MPLTLQPNRRDFCRNVLGGTLIAALGGSIQNTWANESDRDHWVFLSDTHLPGEPNRELNGNKPVKNFIAVREEVLQLDHKPKGVVITGDVAFLHGELEDYRQIASQVAAYSQNGIPVHIAFGNHDHIDHFYAAFSDLKKSTPLVANKHISVLESPHANLFLLDSLYLPSVETGSGFLGLEQLRWLKKELNLRKDKPALLFAHHDLNNRSGSLMDREEFWGIIKAAPQVKAYIFGHTHVYQQEVRDNVHLINLPALGWEFQSGKQPLGWSDVEISGDGIKLTLYTLTSDHPNNGDVRTFDWLR